ncbi:MAG: bifunctional lysylphosphatidylglycerol flippase/synthetase MprF [Parvibaculaceae bacterium]
MSNNDTLFEAAEPLEDTPDRSSFEKLLHTTLGLMRKYRWHLSVIFAFAIVALASLELHNLAHEVHLHQIRRELMHLPIDSALIALAFTVLSFLSLSGQEFLALRSIGRPLSFPRAALGSFIAQSISHSTGFNLFVGGGLRARYYLRLGLTFSETAAVQIAFSGSFALAMCILLGGAMLLDTQVFAGAMHLSYILTKVVGGVAVASGIAVLIASASGKHLTVLGYDFKLPPAGALIGQTLFSACDLLFLTFALHVLLPSDLGVSYFGLLGIVLLAISLGVASNVPGGLGVFESVVLALVTPSPAVLPAVISSLLAFRVIYYFLPLLLGAALAAWSELLQQRKNITRLTKGAVSFSAPMMPFIFGMLAYLCGLILLFSGAMPAVPHRLIHVGNAAPLILIESSHFFASVFGAVLLVLARELTRRKASAWSLTMIVLGLGAIATLIRGLNVEEAAVLILVSLLLYPCREQFYRKSRLGSEPLSLFWSLGFLVAIGAAAWLFFFAYKHVQYSNSLWWQFALEGTASRSMRATVAGAIVLVLLTFASFFHTPKRQPKETTADDWGLALRIVQKSTQASAHLALTTGKSFFFSESRDAMLMYGKFRGSWIVMGDPIGPQDKWRDLVWDFCSLVDQYGGRVVFYEVSTKTLPLFLDVGLQLVKLGEQARVDLAHFSLLGKARGPQRNAQSRALREGMTFQVIAPAEVADVVDQLKIVSDSWLDARNAREKGFSLGSFDEKYLSQCPVALVKYEGRIVAFANLWPSANGEECAVDLMRYERNAPKVTMDYLFTELLLWAQANKFHWFDLGMAPLSGLPDHLLAPMWSKLGRFAVRYGGQFYGFAGLRSFKDKFDPIWQERYLAYPPGTFARTITDVVGLISGYAPANSDKRKRP